LPNLFLANCTTKNITFLYRPIGRPHMLRLEIPAGEQVQVVRNGTSEDIAAILEHNVRYGYIEEHEIKRAPTDVAIEALFGLDKPVDPGNLILAQEHNGNVLTRRGIELRRAAAVGMQQFINQGGLHPEATQVEITEVVKPGEKPSLVEGIRVDPNQSEGIVERRAA
jgi:hypothetical protein